MHKFTLLLKKESRSIIAFAILSAILVTLLLLDFDKNLFSEIFHDICVYTREVCRVFYGLLYPGITFPDFFSIWKHSVGWGEGQTRI